jgi:hypothetical protein
MSDLLDLYNKGIFSQDEQQVEHPQNQNNQLENDSGEKQASIDALKTIMELELGRGFFNEYLDNFIRRLKSGSFKHLSPLSFDFGEVQSSEDNRQKTEQAIDKALAERKGDFFKYIDSLSKLKNLTLNKE